MRKESQDRDEKRRLRLWIFSTIMSERMTYYNPDAVKALNLIDVAFIDDFEVRQAWASLFEALDPGKNATDLEKKGRLRLLLQHMSRSLGLAGKLTVDDLERIYYPTAIAEMHKLQYLQRQAMLKEVERADATNVAR